MPSPRSRASTSCSSARPIFRSSLGVPLDYQCDIYQRALNKIAATAAKHRIAAAMYFIPPGMDPNFFVQKGFKFFTMPWGPWAAAGIQNGLSGIKR